MNATRRNYRVAGHTVTLARTRKASHRMWAEDDAGLARALGLVHAHDRMVQMVLLRLIGQGRLCECLKSSPEMLAIDVFMREMGFRRGADRKRPFSQISARELAEAYTEGVNHVINHRRRPFEFVLAGHKPEPWTVADTVITIKLMSYIGLAQSQQDMEHFLIQSIRAGVSVPRLKLCVLPTSTVSKIRRSSSSDS